jgi:hypothetical protein
MRYGLPDSSRAGTSLARACLQGRAPRPPGTFPSFTHTRQATCRQWPAARKRSASASRSPADACATRRTSLVWYARSTPVVLPALRAARSLRRRRMRSCGLVPAWSTTWGPGYSARVPLYAGRACTGVRGPGVADRMWPITMRGSGRIRWVLRAPVSPQTQGHLYRITHVGPAQALRYVTGTVVAPAASHVGRGMHVASGYARGFIVVFGDVRTARPLQRLQSCDARCGAKQEKHT